MNKADLVEFVHRGLGEDQSKAAVARTIEAVIQALQEGIVQHREVRLSGFGTFIAKQRKQRVGRDPRTGEPIVIPAAPTVIFRPSPELKEAL